MRHTITTIVVSIAAMTAVAFPARTQEPAASQPKVTIPAGTTIIVRMVDGVDSKKSSAGQSFSAALETDLVAEGKVVAPKGSQAIGVLTAAKSAGRLAGKSELAVELTSIVINGQAWPVVTETVEQQAAKSEGRKTARNAAIGAGIGAIVDGGDGAAKGAAVGVGASAVTKGTQVQIPAGSILQFRLLAPFTP